MSRRFSLTLVLVFTVLVAGLLPAVSAQGEETALVRLVHAVPDAPAADFLLNSEAAAFGLSFGEATRYLRLTPGEATLSVQIEGGTVAEASINAGPSQAATVLVAGTAAAPEVFVLEDDLSPLAVGNVRLDAIHAVSGAEDVDVVFSDGSPALVGVSYGNSSGGIDIPANIYPLAVAPAGGTVESALVEAQDYALRAGLLYRLVVIGGDAGTLLLESPVNADGDNILVRVAHTIAGARAVDVYANDTLILPNLADGEVTTHVTLPLGTYDIALRTAGTDATAAPIATGSFDLTDTALVGQGRTIAAVNEGGSPAMAVLDDDIAELDAASARIAVFNAISGATTTVSVDNGSSVSTAASGLASGSTSQSIEVNAGAYTVNVTTNGDGAVNVDGQAFDGGVFYTLFVTGTPEEPVVLVGEVTLNFQPGSVAGIVAAVPEAGDEDEAAAEATEDTTEAAAAPTEAPPAATPPPPPAGLPEDAIIARVNLNPGVNAQLRQYPNTEALVLERAVSGTILEVLGRAGEPDFVGFVDLPGYDDLPREETWVSVVYNIPEGGSVRAWIRGDAVELTNQSGEPVRLADLEPLDSTAAGAVSEAPVAQASPPPQGAAPAPTDFFGEIINLNPGVTLNIRRSAGIDGEVLERIPVGTIVEVVGIPEGREWTFIRYSPAGGGSITGWVDTNYIKFVYQGDQFYPTQEDLDELLLAGAPLTFVDGTEEGSIEPGTPIQPTPVPEVIPFEDQVVATTILNPNATLHLRRDPTVEGESLANIPNAVTMPAFARTADNQWVQVAYENIEGWVASQYVEFRLNGERVDIFAVPVFAPPPTATPAQ